MSNTNSIISGEYLGLVTSICNKIRKEEIYADFKGNELLTTLENFQYDNLSVPINPFFLSINANKFFENNPPDPSIEDALKKFDFHYLRFPVDLKPRVGFNEVQVELVSKTENAADDLPLFYSSFPSKKFIEIVKGDFSGKVELSSGFDLIFPEIKTGAVAMHPINLAADASAKLNFSFDFSIRKMEISKSGDKSNNIMWTFNGGDIRSNLENLTVVIQSKKGIIFNILANAVGRRKKQFWQSLYDMIDRNWHHLTNRERSVVMSGFEFKPEPRTWKKPDSDN